MKTCTILVADDNFNDLEFIRQAIMSYNPHCEIVFVYNGNQLLDFVLRKGRYQNNDCWPHLIILDMVMPFLDGFGVLEALKAASVNIPIYILSSMDSKKNAGKCLKLGVQKFYNKPNNFNEFKKIIGEILSQSDIKPAEQLLK
jgi:two-component system, response regulator